LLNHLNALIIIIHNTHVTVSPLLYSYGLIIGEYGETDKEARRVFEEAGEFYRGFE
jgi:hypothetical protein